MSEKKIQKDREFHEVGASQESNDKSLNRKPFRRQNLPVVDHVVKVVSFDTLRLMMAHGGAIM